MSQVLVQCATKWPLTFATFTKTGTFLGVVTRL